VIIATPRPTAFIVPSAATVATSSFVEDHVMPTSALANAVNAADSPSLITAVFGLTTIWLTVPASITYCTFSEPDAAAESGIHPINRSTAKRRLTNFLLNFETINITLLNS
jgi:hypothetical protein